MKKRILLLMTMAVMAGTMTGCSGKTVKLNDYLTIEYEGYNKYGKARYDIDYEQIVADYSKHIKLSESNSYFSAEDVLKEQIKGKLDKREELSNGDTVTFKWKVFDEQLKEATGLKVKYSDVKEKIKDLEEAELIDGFDGLKINIDGISGSATARIDAEQAPLPSGCYEMDKEQGLKNGDVITITINEGAAINFCNENGIIPKEMSMDYPIEGLREYVSKIADIDDTLMEKMKKQTEDGMKATTATWVRPENFKGMDYLGSYLLSSKETGKNKLYLIYECTYTITDREENNEFKWIWYTSFDEVMKMEDGTCSVDLNTYEGPAAFYNYFSGYSGEYVMFEGEGGKKLAVQGLASVDEFENKYIIGNIDKYTYETTVK